MAEKVALVTAASRGIGRGIATRLTQDGYTVVTLDREAPAALLPGESFIRVDLADGSATAAALAEAVERHAPTRLVNNAGTVRPGPLEDVTVADLEAVVSLNLRCSIQCAQAVLPARAIAIRASSALASTETELSAIAAPASIGLSRPKAASGMPIRL